MTNRRMNIYHIEDLPTYEEMVKGGFKIWDIGELPPRIPFEKLESHLKNDFANMGEDEYGYEISKLTPMGLAVPVFNLL